MHEVPVAAALALVLIYGCAPVPPESPSGPRTAAPTVAAAKPAPTAGALRASVIGRYGDRVVLIVARSSPGGDLVYTVETVGEGQSALTALAARPDLAMDRAVSDGSSLAIGLQAADGPAPELVVVSPGYEASEVELGSEPWVDEWRFWGGIVPLAEGGFLQGVAPHWLFECYPRPASREWEQGVVNRVLGVEVWCRACGATRRATRAGTYGWGTPKRQLLRCGTCGTRFAEPMPRAAIVAGSTCVECLNGLGPHQGHPHPRTCEYNAAVIAAALVAAARGTSYRLAGEKARARASRVRRAAPRVAAPVEPWRQSGNLVMDWTETYAAALWDIHGPDAWPDVIAIDELVVSGRALSASARARQKWAPGGLPIGRSASGRGGRRLYAIIGATGYAGRAAGQPWLFRAVPNATMPEWVEFFRALPGRPSVIVGDAAHAWQQAAAIVWPAPATPELVISEYHLREMLDKHLKRHRIVRGSPLSDLARDAFSDPAHWAALVAGLAPLAATDSKVRKWLRRWTARVSAQLARHAFRHTTRSTGGVEQHLRALYLRIQHRRHMFSNRERLDRLLMLMTLDMRGSADEREWARVIRSWLMVSGGVPPPARQIADHTGGPRQISSLRLGGAST
jgi:hypothetical protein